MSMNDQHEKKDEAAWLKSDLGRLVREAFSEVERASQAYPPMNSPHEGWCVIFEEMDELWEHVRTKPLKRNISAMKKEAIQVAAMALRFALDVCNEERGIR